MKRYMLTLILLVGVVSALSAATRERIPLNEGWRFFFKAETGSDNARFVTLPHTWNSDPCAVGIFLETTGNYQNDLYIPAEWSGKRLFLRFHGAQSTATLFVNGFHAGEHRGGGVAFTFEITEHLRFGANNALLVVVSNGYRDDTLPTSTDINLYGGITRPVELIVTDPTAVSPLYLGTEGVLVRPESISAERVEGTVEVHLTSREEHATTLHLDIADPSGCVVFTRHQRARIDDKPVTVHFAIDHPALWSPASPALYTVTVRLGDDGTRDAVSLRTGFRAVVVTAERGFTLNGERIPLYGVVLHHDNALSGGLPTAEEYAADLAQLRDLGANALRSAVMPHPAQLYDRCDEEGIVAWVDLPLHRAPFMGDVAYYATQAFERHGEQLLDEIIAQHLNHPSVVMWGLFSELWNRGDNVIPYLRRLNERAHRLDPSRPTVAASNQDGEINFITNLIVWRQEAGWRRGSTDDVALWRDILQQRWSHLRSGVIYGGGALVGHTAYTAQGAPGANWLPEENQSRFHEEYARALQPDSLFWGVWIANLFDYGSARRPYGINSEGLVTLDRRTRKDAFYLYRALWNHESPTLHLTGKRIRMREAAEQTFRVYSSAGAPTLLVGGDTVAMSQYAPCQYRSDTVSLNGTVRVEVQAGALRDSVTLRIGNALTPRRTPAPLQIKGLQKTN